MNETYTKLNLGCGQFPKNEYINVDIDPRAKADIFHDLSIFPYPFNDEQFKLIEMSHVLEHLPDPLAVMREAWRLLIPGGTLHIGVPHFSRALTHYDHKRGFDVTFPRYFDPSFTGGFTGIHFEHVSTRLRWFASPWLKKNELSPFLFRCGNFLGTILDFVGNINLYATSRIFCFWVGGYEEVEFFFKKPI